MKKLKTVFPAISAVLFCIAFLACSEEDDPVDEEGSDTDTDTDSDSDSDTDSDSDSDLDSDLDSGLDTDSNSVVCSNLVATGHTVGKVPENITLLDADGKPHSLWDHCGDVIVVEYACMW